MTEPQNPDPAPPPSAPPPPPPPGSGQPPVNWASTAQPQAPVPGAAGLVYADVPNRIIALIIDVIILAIIGFIAAIVVTAIFGSPVDVRISPSGEIETTTNIVPTLINLVVSLGISVVYWTYTWTALRASPGQKVLGMQVGNWPDGATLTTDQALRRWVALGGPLPIVQALNPLPGLGIILGLAAFAYFIYLLWTTAQSPTKRGFHDVFANSVVVKAARAV